MNFFGLRNRNLRVFIFFGLLIFTIIHWSTIATVVSGNDSTCSITDVEGIHADLADLEESTPVLKSKKIFKDGKCEYALGYSHINELIRFNQKMRPQVIHEPAECSFIKNKRDFIIFGIKSRPESVDLREAIRESWLSEPIWDWLGFEIKVVFIIGRPGEVDLSFEMEIHDDLLVLDVDESLYNLSYKDIGFFKFVKRACFSADFVFIGDDDILVIPQNLAFEIQRIKYEPQTQAIGCLKPEEPAVRDPRNKYFIPNQFYSAEKYPQYLSGGGYVTSLHFALEIENQISHNPVLPMKDTYIGTLVNAANMGQHMSMSMSFCMGLNAWFKTEMEVNKDVCFLRGLTLAHKYKDPEEMKRLFRSVVSGDTSCNNYKPFSFSNIRVFYGPRFWHDDRREAWKRNIENFRIFIE